MGLVVALAYIEGRVAHSQVGGTIAVASADGVFGNFRSIPIASVA